MDEALLMPKLIRLEPDVEIFESENKLITVSTLINFKKTSVISEDLSGILGKRFKGNFEFL